MASLADLVNGLKSAYQNEAAQWGNGPKLAELLMRDKSTQGVQDYAGNVQQRASALAGLLRGQEPTPQQRGLFSIPDVTTPQGALEMAGNAPMGLLGITKQLPTQYELAHQLAQRNAALPVEKGGLGLSPNNTAMDRAEAMGFDTPAYHGSKYGINDGIADDKAYIGASFLTDNKKIASNYAEGKTPTGIDNAFIQNEIEQQGYVLPMQVKLKKPLDESVSLDDIYGAEKANELRADDFSYDPKPFSSSIEEGTDLNILAHMYAQFPKVREKIKAQGYDGFKFNDIESGGVTSVPFSKEQLRSRFAAFDPMQRNSADLLAGVAPYAIPAGLAGLLGYGMTPQDAMAADNGKTKTKR